MVQFAKLRLAGFKSFVDPTELLIEPGMTGIVGPNGCGKSNLVEALRWAMGETSAKRMRGGEMDDIIFSGNAVRPARNVAEVALQIDNSTRNVPAQFNEFDDIEVARRIERGMGSSYRVNGAEVRARDVQLLFADAATGAHSTALVSQGRVGAIINAKPVDRRQLLEEAAGITGLHSRRHEAELRLRAAESNMARLDDVIVTMEGQLQALKKQARQAARYRSLNDRLRRAEAALLLMQWHDLEARLAAAAAELEAANADVAALTSAAAREATAESEAAALLPERRRTESEAAAELQRLTLARHSLDEEEARVGAAIKASEEHLAQIDADAERERALATDAAAAEARLTAEAAEIEARTRFDEAETEAVAEALAAARIASAGAEAEFTALTQRIASAEAKGAALFRRVGELEARIERLRGRTHDVESERDALAQSEGEDAGVAAAEIEQARAAFEAAQVEAAAADKARQAALPAEAAARESWQAFEAAHARLTVEAEALATLFQGPEFDAWPPLVDRLIVEPGYEKALGAALGDDLSASLETAAPLHWRLLADDGMAPTLPPGAVKLSNFVTGAPALARRLDQVGLVADESLGRALADKLTQGQRLVTIEGALWRWDGLTMSPGGTSTALSRLEQRKRLNDLCSDIRVAKAALDEAEARHAAVAGEAQAGLERDRACRQKVRETLADLEAVRGHAQATNEARAASAARLAALTAAAQEIAADAADSDLALATARTELAGLPDVDALRREAMELGQRLAQRRSHLIETLGAHERLQREAEARARRSEELVAEQRSWASRAAAVSRQLESLAWRRQASAAEKDDLAQRPVEIAARRVRLAEMIETSAAQRRAAADHLAQAETAATEAGRRRKTAEGLLGEARERRVRAEAGQAQANEAQAALTERVHDRLESSPDKLGELAELDEAGELPDRAQIEQRLQRLHAERDAVGPVNLRAEAEAEELEQQITGMRSERNDLMTAIERLRHGIASLNREGRERLLAAFTQVNEHFTQLFTRLFGGGKAFLKLTENEDPLEAGLEIMASPPGKKLQVMSLLSGGEQALTALSLLFAVFLTNPAPICVLDEVDAPLDDANVDRFCTLVDELARQTQTRFLIITHHRLTMARMDRLYGVTMAERGVSQIVSVDLAVAEQLRATA